MSSARLAEILLRSCPKLHVLATSRERLAVAGEVLFPLSPLATPEIRRSSRDSEELERIESVRLFVERARAADAGFALTTGNAAALAQICRRLDGIPLALELAAARVAALAAEEIARRLDDRFHLLTAGSRTVPAPPPDAARPHRLELRPSLREGADALPPSRGLHRAMAAGGAEEVCAGDGLERREILDLHSRLVEKSLVERDAAGERRCGQVRYRALETIREYALEQLRSAGEEAETRRRHREWVLALAVASSPHLVGPDQGEWSQRLEVEHDNIRAAIADACRCGARPDVETALRIAASLGRYWYGRGRWTEGRAAHEGDSGGCPARRRATRPGPRRSPGPAGSRYGRATSMRPGTSTRRASPSAGSWATPWGSLSRSTTSGPSRRSAASSMRAAPSIEESLAIRRAEGNLRYQAVSLHNLGEVCFRMGDVRGGPVL